jgi:hypothetical protein
MSKGTLSFYEFTEDEFMEKLNVAKDLILEELYKDGYIKDDVHPLKLAEYYVIEVATKAKFGNILSNVFKLEDKGGKMVVLRTSSTMPGMEDVHNCLDETQCKCLESK